MKKTICILLAAILLFGLLSACGSKQPTGGGLEDNVLENDPVLNTNPQNQETTKATEDQNSTQPTSGQENSGSTQPTQDQQNTDSTQPTQGQQNTGSTQPTQGQDTDATSPTTGNSSEATDPAAPALDYEAFRALEPAKQQEYQESFDSLDAFFKWYNAAYKAYLEANPRTEIGSDGSITLP